MKIVGFDIRLVSIPLAREVKWAGASEMSNDVLVLRVETDEGCFGLAEKKIHPAWAGMSPRMVAMDLKDVCQPLLCGVDPLCAERVWARLDRVRGWSPAKALLDIAIHDLQARAANLPMWKFLGGWSDSVEVLGFIARGDSRERLATIGQQIAAYGFRGFKIKIGTDAAADCAFLKELRTEFGDELLIRVDANSGYTLDEALWVSHRLADLGVQDFEDPCRLTGANVRAELLRRSAVPVVIDNIIDSPAMARVALEQGALRLALKVSRLGYRQAREIMAACRVAGAQVISGSMTECSLGALGALHFHAAFPDFAWAPAEDSYFAVLPDDVFPRPSIVDGRVSLGTAAGLSPDWIGEKLARYSQSLNA